MVSLRQKQLVALALAAVVYRETKRRKRLREQRRRELEIQRKRKLEKQRKRNFEKHLLHLNRIRWA